VLHLTDVGYDEWWWLKSDLHSVIPGNYVKICRWHIYSIIPATSANSAEISYIETWTCNNKFNNLILNPSKSLEIIFVNLRSRVKATVPSSTVLGFTQVEEIKMLGVTFSQKFCVNDVNNRLSRCSQAIVINKLSYVSQPGVFGQPTTRIA